MLRLSIRHWCTFATYCNRRFATCFDIERSVTLISLIAPFPDISIAISTGVYDNLNLFEQFAAAAYCPGNNNDKAGNSKITCDAGNCPLVQNSDVISVYEFEKYASLQETTCPSPCYKVAWANGCQSSLATDVTGYVAIDNSRSLTVISFRGSQSVRNFVADAKFPAIPTDICPSCTAHAGFWNS